MGTLGDLYVKLGKDPRIDQLLISCLLIFETLLGLLIIQKVPYIEIDWQAYMEEVQMWLDGEMDYAKIRGGTGPLVYPAGFLYLFAFFRYITNDGDDIRLAQYIFLALYITTQYVVLRIYKEAQTYDSPHRTWSWRIAMVVLCLSKRIHSIFVLRLFNDGPTMLLLYISILLFARQRWNAGCFLFSLAVSIKMNVLLFAPGLLLLLLQREQTLYLVIRRIFIFCAIPQFILGFPFLATYPISYIRKAFELDRVFMYKWTVNLKFLPEDIFISKTTSVLLLVLHLGGLSLYAVRWLMASREQLGKRVFVGRTLSPVYIIYTMFVTNFIGICFARTLHYQFYSWYFHSVPFLLWSSSRVPLPLKLLVVAAIESSFLTFPATPTSSAVLQLANFLVLISIETPEAIEKRKVD